MLSVLITVVIFLIMISLHEFGHFLFGKLLGFNVLEYAIGFGPAIWKKQGKKTLYSLRIIPFGGYCRFDGEDEDKEGTEGAFNEQKCWKRCAVLFAGAFFNILLGFAVYICLAAGSETIYTNTVAGLVENTALYESGVSEGDVISAIDGHHIGSYRDIQLYTMDLKENVPIKLTVKRNGDKHYYEIMPTKQVIKAEYTENDIVYTETLGDKSETMHISYDETNPFNVNNVGKTEEYERFLIGFTPQRADTGFVNVIGDAANMTSYIVRVVCKSLFELVTGKVGVEQVSGPVGVVREVKTAVDSGRNRWIYVVNIMALLTINLGVMNLLPIPALDGGRILFVIVEWIRRKPVPRDKEGIVHTVGFGILFLIMILVFIQDIVKLF